jgi:hypothetical protein
LHLTVIQDYAVISVSKLMPYACCGDSRNMTTSRKMYTNANSQKELQPTFLIWKNHHQPRGQMSTTTPGAGQSNSLLDVIPWRDTDTNPKGQNVME